MSPLSADPGQIQTLLVPMDADVENRLASLRSLAAECDRFVQESEAIARARQRIATADHVIGSLPYPVPRAVDETDEIEQRTRAILGAYRDLTTDHTTADPS
jgi:hypothetical protein